MKAYHILVPGWIRSYAQAIQHTILTLLSVPSLTRQPAMSTTGASVHSELSDNKWELRQEFRTLTCLIALSLKFIGGDGRLSKELHSVERAPRSNQRYPYRILSAVSDVLVRQCEVVAVANYINAESISALSTEDWSTDYQEPDDISQHHMKSKVWRSWIGHRALQFFTVICALVNPNTGVNGSMVKDSNVINVVKPATASSLFKNESDPFQYYTQE